MMNRLYLFMIFFSLNAQLIQEKGVKIPSLGRLIMGEIHKNPYIAVKAIAQGWFRNTFNDRFFCTYNEKIDERSVFQFPKLISDLTRISDRQIKQKLNEYVKGYEEAGKLFFELENKEVLESNEEKKEINTILQQLYAFRSAIRESILKIKKLNYTHIDLIGRSMQVNNKFAKKIIKSMLYKPDKLLCRRWSKDLIDPRTLFYNKKLIIDILKNEKSGELAFSKKDLNIHQLCFLKIYDRLISTERDDLCAISRLEKIHFHPILDTFDWEEKAEFRFRIWISCNNLKKQRRDIFTYVMKKNSTWFTSDLEFALKSYLCSKCFSENSITELFKDLKKVGVPEELLSLCKETLEEKASMKSESFEDLLIQYNKKEPKNLYKAMDLAFLYAKKRYELDKEFDSNLKAIGL